MLNIPEFCSQPFYFSTRAKEEASEVSGSTRHEEVKREGGGGVQKAKQTRSPLLRQFFDFGLASSYQAILTASLTIE